MAKRIKRNNHLAILLVFFGAFFVSISTTHSFFRRRSLSLDQNTVDAYLAITPQKDPREALIPTHVYSQYFLDVAIEPQVYKNGHWTIAGDAASYLISSARPTEQGNIILYGHNKRANLGNIRAYKGGETITLTLADGTMRQYQVKSFVQVNPANTELLLPTKDETLTLYTCAGLMDSERFVVTAIPITK